MDDEANVIAMENLHPADHVLSVRSDTEQMVLVSSSGTIIVDWPAIERAIGKFPGFELDGSVSLPILIGKLLVAVRDGTYQPPGAAH